MAYPKPLSEKRIQNMYIASGLDEEKLEFFHTFFTAAANLYGSVQLRDLWEVYRDIADREGWPIVRKKEMLAFSEITRREPDVSYYIYEIDELYSEEPRTDIERFLIRRDIIWTRGSRSLEVFWRLDKLQLQVPFYEPSDFLSYANMDKSTAEKELLDYVGNLKVTAKYSEIYNRKVKCTHRGEYLKDFEALLEDEKWMIESYDVSTEALRRRNGKMRAELEKEYSGIFADRIVSQLMWRCSTGWTNVNSSLEYFLNDLNEIGVELSKKQLDKLLSLIMNAQNETHLMCNRGWTPTELAIQTYKPGTIPSIQLGPNIRKAIENGEIDKDELVRMAAEKGIRIL